MPAIRERIGRYVEYAHYISAVAQAKRMPARLKNRHEKFPLSFLKIP